MNGNALLLPFPKPFCKSFLFASAPSDGHFVKLIVNELTFFPAFGPFLHQHRAFFPMPPHQATSIFRNSFGDSLAPPFLLSGRCLPPSLFAQLFCGSPLPRHGGTFSPAGIKTVSEPSLVLTA